jgi:hypothetical protein
VMSARRPSQTIANGAPGSSSRRLFEDRGPIHPGIVLHVEARGALITESLRWGFWSLCS